ncbi:carbohydrate ABC transporter substrate-binding protein [Eubacterium sp. OM08-24]|jgi:ABC-type glycerol-3-phosphate transport system substrate-binding protein|uniref:ABC transporter substrate-binding protein n=1 Tax=Eubacterium sp. OM08-24 TaxID=2292352 RepID=UPI000E434279|nr:ABC transporter substrate-binding protein [Eubacterium sp. OM08-24]RGM18927.1 carbohydrate ABC transporter substrate-binding protein [Eubacterium sp. OM08-24]
MKKVFSNSIILAILCAMLLSFTSCDEYKIKSNEKLKYYTSNAEDDFSSLIKQYNKICLEKYDESYQIEIIEFENNDDMCTKMSTEIMAGEGPDIISLNQNLPFEKLIENEAFLDINSLINNDETKDKIELDEYNSFIMNVGVYDGKRYIVPLSYGMDVLVSTQERLKQFNVSGNNGETLTYSNVSVKFSPFFNSTKNYSFVSNDSDTGLWFDHPMQLFSRFINSYIDFDNKSTFFTDDEFKDNLDIMREMVINTREDNSNALFDDLYINRSLPLITGKYAYYKSIGETPVVFRGLVKSDDIYSAFLEIGFAINNNTKLQEQAYAFIKYALSDDCQMRICGAKGNSLSASISFPLNNKAYEQLKYTASRVTDDDDRIIGIDNDFISTYMKIADYVNQCTLYRDASHSYYNSSVIGDIVDKYLSGDISKEKFIRQLTAATEIYLTE